EAWAIDHNPTAGCCAWGWPLSEAGGGAGRSGMRARTPFLSCRGLTLAALLIAALLPPPHASAQGANPISFMPPQIIQMPGGASGIVAGDLDGDGKGDLVVNGGTQIAILYGRGDGTFESPVSYPADGPIAHILPVDVNGDGKLDMVAALPNGNSVIVMLNL